MDPEPQVIHDAEWLTQFGSIVHPIAGEVFKACPTYGQEDLSFLRGRRTVDEAAMSVNRRRTSGAVPGEGARYVTAGKLRAAGFTVMHTPRRHNLDHVSVTVESTGGNWTQDDKLKFGDCFDVTDQAWKEGHLERVSD